MATRRWYGVVALVAAASSVMASCGTSDSPDAAGVATSSDPSPWVRGSEDPMEMEWWPTRTLVDGGEWTFVENEFSTKDMDGEDRSVALAMYELGRTSTPGVNLPSVHFTMQLRSQSGMESVDEYLKRTSEPGSEVTSVGSSGSVPCATVQDPTAEGFECAIEIAPTAGAPHGGILRAEGHKSFDDAANDGSVKFTDLVGVLEAMKGPIETGQEGGSAEPSSNASAPAGGTSTSGDVDPVISYEWSDKEGYSYRWEVLNPVISVETNTEDQLPGKGLATVQWSADALVTNTTPNRTVKSIRIERMQLVAAYPERSPVCDLEGTPWMDESTDPDTGEESSESGYCYLRGPERVVFEDSAGGLSSGVPVSASYVNDFSDVVTAEEFEVDEAQLDEVSEAFKTPEFWAIVRSSRGLSQETGRCDVRAGGRDFTQQRDGAVVKTTAEGSNVCAQDVQ